MYNKILVPLDGSDLAECVLPHVESLARGCQPVRIVLAQVVDQGGDPVISESWGPELQEKLELAREGMEEQDRQQAQEYLNRILEKLKLGDSGDIAVIEGAHPAESLLEYAKNNQAGLIVIATHGRSGLSRWAWGSVAERILRGGCVPVIMVRAPGCGPLFEGTA